MEEQLYNILTYIIIISAVAVAIKKLLEKHTVKQNQDSCNDGCGGCSSKCDIKSVLDSKKVSP